MSNSACLNGGAHLVLDDPFRDEVVQFLDLKVERPNPPRWQHFSDHRVPEFFRQQTMQKLVIQAIRERLHTISAETAGA